MAGGARERYALLIATPVTDRTVSPPVWCAASTSLRARLSTRLASLKREMARARAILEGLGEEGA
jgi:uncharacterized protein YceH (UPF0502 family)